MGRTLLGISLLMWVGCAVPVSEGPDAGNAGTSGGGASSGGSTTGGGSSGGGSSGGFVGCGDGVVSAGEQCDWGSGTHGACTGPDGGCNSDTLPNHCRDNCTLPSCGDGVVDMGEKCDLGSLNGTEQGCNATCTLLGKATRIAGNGDVVDGGRCDFSCYADGPGDQAMFQQVAGLAVVGTTLYVADTLDEVIRAVDLSSAPAYNVTTLAGNVTTATTQDGTGLEAGFFLPFTVMAYEGSLLVGTGMNLRQITLPGAVVTTLAGPDTGNKASENNASQVPLSLAYFNKITGLALDQMSGFIYSVDQGSGMVRQIEPSAGIVNDLAGAGTGGTFQDPTSGVVLDGGLFLSDTGNDFIKRIDLASSTVTPVAGSGSPGFSNSSVPYNNSFNTPAGLCSDGQSIYIVDQGNMAIRQMNPVSFALSTVIGGPDAGVFDSPYACTWDPVTQALYVTDQSVPDATPDGIGNVIYMIQ